MDSSVSLHRQQSHEWRVTYVSNLSDELVTHTAFPDHQLRIKEPTLCDPSVKQYSGYLDIADDKHLFFWLAVNLLPDS